MPAAAPAEISVLMKLVEMVPGLGHIAGVVVAAIIINKYVIFPIWTKIEVGAKARRDHDKSIALAHQAAASSLDRFGENLRMIVNKLVGAGSAEDEPPAEPKAAERPGPRMARRGD